MNAELALPEQAGLFPVTQFLKIILHFLMIANHKII